MSAWFAARPLQPFPQQTEEEAEEWDKATPEPAKEKLEFKAVQVTEVRSGRRQKAPREALFFWSKEQKEEPTGQRK